MRKHLYVDEEPVREDHDTGEDDAAATGGLPNRLLTAFEVAEYIGWRPKSAAQSWRRDSVRRSLNGGAPKSMVPVEPGPDAPDRALDTFYGLSHLAVDCMAKKYGEAKMFTFVKLLLTQSDNDLDKAARAAYGLPFGTVDHACAAWIKTQV